VRDGVDRLRAGRPVAVAAVVAAGLLSTVVAMPRAYASAAQTAGRTATEESGAVVAPAGVTYLPASDAASASAVPAVQLAATPSAQPVLPLGPLQPADLLVIAPHTLPPSAIVAIRKLAGVSAASLLDAARIKVNGSYVATLGVDPSTFRVFAAMPTAASTVLWQGVADGGIAVSYLMGKEEKLPLGGAVTVAGAQTEQLRVAGFGTVGISGVDAVVSDSVARSLGIPAGNAIVISAPQARLSTLIQEVGRVLPKEASVAPLVAQAAEPGLPTSAGSAGAITITPSSGPGLTTAQTQAFLTAALSRVGLPYVWGGSGPDVFDCSGLVQWSMRQAGIVMPRVAVDQARTGPQVPLADLQPGDLLFYHTDPTAPTYISHVAIYLGNGLMLQAPQPGENVQVVPASFNGGFAGAVRVYPRVAAAVAGNIAG
jgi:cell wall-associated NlpC family hydrolase